VASEEIGWYRVWECVCSWPYLTLIGLRLTGLGTKGLEPHLCLGKLRTPL
jgi:hypothetical protein